MPYKRYIDDPNFRGNLEAILERLEAQETTSPLELGASIMQAYSQRAWPPESRHVGG